jgi:hypothetical protein
MPGFDSLSPAYLFASLLVGSIGFVLFRYGRAQRRMPHTGMGVVLMVYPYFVTNVGAMLVIAALLCAALWSAVRFLHV